MSCCTIEKPSDNCKEISMLKKSFDEVLIEDKEIYTLVTLKDKVNKANYDYVVWLQIKVNKDTGRGSAPGKKLEAALESICLWLPILKDFEKSSEPKQLSLFDEDTQNDLEKMPECPINPSDSGWAKYDRDCVKIRKINLMKQYSFFELLDPTNQHWHYSDIDFTSMLPKNNAEMIELAKQFIVGDYSNPILSKEDEFDDEYSYLTRDGALSDIELFSRVSMLLRFDLIPYKSYTHISRQNDFRVTCFEEQTRYRYWLHQGKEINGPLNDKRKLPTYDLYDDEFILWLREHFKIPKTDVISDEGILILNLRVVLSRALGKEFNVIEEIDSSKTFKIFKSKVMAVAKLGNGGGSGESLDGFNASFSLFSSDKSKCITIEQSRAQREALGRSIEGLEQGFRDGYVYVYKLSFEQCLEKAYELLGKKEDTLFDFLAV